MTGKPLTATPLSRLADLYARGEPIVMLTA
ncbi:MAG: hypothetical protein JWN53_79, partial [Gemmatimonadetes bacterium]|nr:hypothetical protein [Gemmatimonadota bacterium]